MILTGQASHAAPLCNSAPSHGTYWILTLLVSTICARDNYTANEHRRVIRPCCVGPVSATIVQFPKRCTNSYSCVTHLSVLQSTIPRTKKFIAALNMRTHATVRLTAFELQLPTDPTTITVPGKALDDTLDSSEATTSANTKTVENQSQNRPRSRSPSHKRTDSDRRSSAHSATRSMHSEHPLVPLQLTPSAEQYFTTEIVAQPESTTASADRTSKKYDTKDWKKYLRRSKNEDDMALSSMFSWKSRNSYTRERIVQTKEVTQKVEVVQPKESRWTFRRQSEGSKRHSQGPSPGEGSKRQSVGREGEGQS